MSDIQGQRLNYLETVAKTKDGKEVVFTDPMNKFLDDLLIAVDANTAGAGASGTVTSVAVSGSDGIEVDSGSPVTTSGTIALGLNKTTTLAFLNVEDGADVTDTANVTSAGALMDSEVTNLTQVKAFDATDYAVALGVDDNYVTDAEKIVIGNTSGTNTGDMSNAAVKTAYELNANTNAYTDAEVTKLSGIETGATADQTGAQIKTAYEAEANAFTDTLFTKLSGIESSADVTDATNVNAAGAVMLSDTVTTGMGFVLDEDTLSTDSATKLATQQSIKAYVDAAALGGVTKAQFSAGLTSSSSLTAATPKKLTGWTEDWDTSGLFASNKFTSTKTAHYSVRLRARFGGLTSGDRIRLYLYKNGSAVGQIYRTAAGSSVTTLSLNQVVSLVNTDYLEMWVENVDTSGSISSATSANRTLFQVSEL